MSEACDAYLLEWVEEERASLISSLVPSPFWLLKEAHWSLPTFLYVWVPARQETAAAPTAITSQLVVSFTLRFPESSAFGVEWVGVQGAEGWRGWQILFSDTPPPPPPRENISLGKEQNHLKLLDFLSSCRPEFLGLQY